MTSRQQQHNKGTSNEREKDQCSNDANSVQQRSFPICYDPKQGFERAKRGINCFPKTVSNIGGRWLKRCLPPNFYN